jgi:hypothetical protein
MSHGVGELLRHSQRLRFKSCDELNAWFLDKCLPWAKAHADPERPEQTIWEVFEDERSNLSPVAAGIEDLPGPV